MSSASGGGGGGGGRRITITSISCRGVRAFVPFQKPPLYATVSLGGRREKTPPDPDGGENADWDGAVFAFDLGGDGGQEQLVQFEVKAQVPVLGNKLVGTAGVPAADLASGGAAPRHVSYQISAPDGKPNGTLSFAYAIGDGGARPQPQIYQGPDGAWPDQNPSFGCAAYPAPATASFAPHSGGAYPPSPPVSPSLYSPLQDLLTPTPSSYPPPPPPLNPQFLHPNSSSYPPLPAPVTAYPPPAASCTAYPAPPAHYITSYPPPPSAPPTSYPPPPPGGYPPPVSDLPPPTSTYPPPPLPETGSRNTVDRALPYYPAPPSQDAAIAYPPTAPPGGSFYYPPPGTRHPELGGAAGAPYHYPTPPGTRYP